MYFDFTCRFANRLALWLAKVDVDTRWLPFSLLEAKRGDSDPPVWQDANQADNISLLMLAGHELVRERRGDTATYRREVFAAWHGGEQRLNEDSVISYAGRAGVSAGTEDLHAALAFVGHRHCEAVERGVFGSSTLVFSTGRGCFVRFASLPGIDNASSILRALRTLADCAPELDHLEPLRH